MKIKFTEEEREFLLSVCNWAKKFSHLLDIDTDKIQTVIDKLEIGF